MMKTDRWACDPDLEGSVYKKLQQQQTMFMCAAGAATKEDANLEGVIATTTMFRCASGAATRKIANLEGGIATTTMFRCAAGAATRKIANLEGGIATTMNSKQRAEDPSRESSNKLQKRVTAMNRDLPPRDERFILDYEQLRMQYSDQDQLQAVTESVLISFVLQCSSHTPQSEFLLFAATPWRTSQFYAF